MPDNLSLGRNELLARALDRAALNGLCTPKATKMLHDLFGSKCVVDPAANQVLLNDKPTASYGVAFFLWGLGGKAMCHLLRLR